ncbi:hypothetical protein FF38_13500 [Lucilia cuprina]|uniref:Uncharacterized protein n=1 Tax=Lucilia cuprina TaxID=7375 RepID=A0A0L0CEJ4_LUCCU|nr:hypothetical protein FF38_13500 [Lucilia cuprina]
MGEGAGIISEKISDPVPLSVSKPSVLIEKKQSSIFSANVSFLILTGLNEKKKNKNQKDHQQQGPSQSKTTMTSTEFSTKDIRFICIVGMLPPLRQVTFLKDPIFANWKKRATYSFLASSCDLPFCLFHDSHLALPFKSNKPGLLVLLSPTVACLKRAYNSKNSSSVGRLVKVLTRSAAALNC